jgi:hypothetical protein
LRTVKALLKTGGFVESSPSHHTSIWVRIAFLRSATRIDRGSIKADFPTRSFYRVSFISVYRCTGKVIAITLRQVGEIISIKRHFAEETCQFYYIYGMKKAYNNQVIKINIGEKCCKSVWAFGDKYFSSVAYRRKLQSVQNCKIYFLI